MFAALLEPAAQLDDLLQVAARPGRPPRVNHPDAPEAGVTHEADDQTVERDERRLQLPRPDHVRAPRACPDILRKYQILSKTPGALPYLGRRLRDEPEVELFARRDRLRQRVVDQLDAREVFVDLREGLPARGPRGGAARGRLLHLSEQEVALKGALQLALRGVGARTPLP